MRSTFLPVKLTNEIKHSGQKILCPYMGYAEYEFGAPQKTYAALKEAMPGDNLRKVIVGEYATICLGEDQEEMRSLLTAMTDGTLENKGGNLYKTHFRVKHEEVKMWLSMEPHAVVAKLTDFKGSEEAYLQWIYHYGTGQVFKDNTEMRIGDVVTAVVERRTRSNSTEMVMADFTVCGIPENDYTVTLKSKLMRKTFRDIPVWCVWTKEVM